MGTRNQSKWFSQKYGTKMDRARSILSLPVGRQDMYMNYLPLPGFLLENNWESVVFMLTIGGEARSESDEGIQAVAEVIINRYRQQKSYFGFTIRDVCIKQSDGVHQFSCWRRTGPNRKWMQQPEAPDLQQIVDLCLPILHGVTPTFYNRRVCYYKHINIGDSGFWGRLHHVKRIGAHDFYEDLTLST